MSGNMSRYDTEGFLLNVRSISRQEGSPILQKNLPRGSSSGSDGRSQTQEIDGAQPPRYSSLANTKDHSIENYELKKSEMFLHNLYDDPAPIPPCTSPIPSTRSDTSNSITPPSRQPIRLDLALEDNFEEDEELPTTRLLDGLGVNVVNGIPQVMISSDLKTLLKKKMESNSGEENGNQNNHLRDSWMEPSNSHTTPRHHTSIASESGQIRMSHVSDDVVVQDINEESTTLNSFRIRSIKEAAKSSIAEVERARADLETELKSILRSTGPKSTSQSERVTFQDQKDQTYKEPALEIPLVNRAAYEDLIDNDIEERVRQLQLENDRIGALQSCEEVRELGFDEDLIRSKQLLNQLENDIENTVFEVPDFGRNSPPVEPELQCLDNEKPDDQFCKLPSRNYNVERQAKSLGLKRRDLSHIFINSESKQNRMKNYRPTATKPNTKKATSRIDSGKKTANHSVRSVAQRMPGFDSKQSGLNVYNVLNGEKTTPNANSYQQELMYQNYKSSLNSQRRKPEKVNKTINKTITTLQLGDDGISEVKEKSSLSNKVPYERTRIDYPQRNRTPTKSPLLTSTHEQNDTIFNASRSVIGESMINRLGTVGIYNHFVVPANIQSLQPVFNHLWLSHVGGMVLATLETCNSKEEAELNYNRLLSAISLTSQIKTQSKFMQMKFACIFPMNTLIELTKLDKEQRETFMELAAEFLSGDKDTTDLAQFGFDSITLEYVVKGLEYMRVIGQKLEEAEIMMMIDAEYTYTNDALSMLTKSFALAKNRHKPLIWNTYQCFLKVTFDRLKEDMKFYRKHDIHFGAKIVKGAYMVPEREYSDKHSLPYPVHDSYEQTNHAYDTIMAWLMDEAIQVGKTRFMLASHNQNAVETCINRMEKLGVDKNDKLIMFGQQYGMCDHVSFALGNAEYPVFKSIAVGTVSETLPYLSRRAQENTSVMQNSTQERAILRGQLFKRLNPFR